MAHYCCWLQKEFVDPAMGSPALLPGGDAIIPAVTEAVAVARERGIFIVWVGFSVAFDILLYIILYIKIKHGWSIYRVVYLLLCFFLPNNGQALCTNEAS
jgi:hypothetical protein